jgi:hypothetical protein
MEVAMKLKWIKIIICEPCLNGEGEVCHTPGCAFFMHNSLGFEVTPELYEIIEEFDD